MRSCGSGRVAKWCLVWRDSSTAALAGRTKAGSFDDEVSVERCNYNIDLTVLTTLGSNLPKIETRE